MSTPQPAVVRRVAVPAEPLDQLVLPVRAGVRA